MVNLIPQVYQIQGNQPLLLNEPETLWIVNSGSLAVFTTVFEGQEPKGNRRYLFTVNSGEALLGATPKDERGILAIALEKTELSALNIEYFITQIRAGDRSSFALLSGWVNHWEKLAIPDLPLNSKILKCPEISPSKLAEFHHFLFYHLNREEINKKAEKFRKFQEREHLNKNVTETAFKQLTGVLHPPKTEVFLEGTPLLIASGAVGRATGIIINPPAESEDFSRLKYPLEAIARASQFRTRRVLLTGNWWKQEHGPLLAYIHTNKRPVALLPEKGNHYILFDPVERTRTRVTKAVAPTLSPESFMFYRPLPPVIHHAAELFQFGIKGYEKNIIEIVILGIIATLLGMAIPQATAILVNDAIPDSDRLLLWQIGLVLVAVTIGKSAFGMAQAILSLRVENAADSALQPAVWDRMLKLKPAFFRCYSSGDLLTRLMAVSQIRQLISGATQRTLLNAVFSLLNLGLMLFYSWKLALVGVGLTGITVIFTGVSSLLLIRQERQQETADGEINGLTVELINGVSKLRVATAEERAFAAWAKKYSRRLKLKANIQRINDGISVFNEVLPLLSSILIFGFAIAFIQAAKSQGNTGLNMGTFIAFNSAFGTFISGVTDLSNTLTDILGIIPLWERAKPIVQGTIESDPTKADPGRLRGKIAVDRVIFRYQENGALILNDITIHAEPGEFIAIVGPSGSGKSTLFRLLLGFETPESGSIYYDDKDLAGLDIQAVRRQLGAVLQNGRINAGSVFDNITCGALVTLEEAWEAAQMAGLAVDLEQMPMGIHTVVSEGGTNLSGGQKQRLLIARAMVLKPKIVLMDEATSALDNRTQAIVSESLERLNATRIVIAHRLSTIRNADRIYVIESGRLVEVGSFDQLLQRGGLFARLVARQLQ
ncbi:MAG: NHLP bacteriocin export ABC transporter permease/ATPase subunit [Lyngbya sp.]|nr:NHLP bacteriocin export ABC transporter permease/ATPase subunit [Lyngbya sp.]